MINIYIRYFVDGTCVVEKIALNDKILAEFDIRQGAIDFSCLEPYSGEECNVVKTILLKDGTMKVEESEAIVTYKQENGINKIWLKGKED